MKTSKNESKNESKKISKFLSLILRHSPEEIGLELDANGWAEISDIIEKSAQTIKLNGVAIKEVIASSDKQRFKISNDGLRVRANQGHSIKIDLELQPVSPPKSLYHGTAYQFVDSISRDGLLRGARQYVHLSSNVEVARFVGQRHGKPIVLQVDSGSMSKQGFSFLLSDNNVWLTEHVPSEFLIRQD